MPHPQMFARSGQPEIAMPMGLMFWILMLIWAVFGVWWNWPNHYVVGGNVLLFILLVLLGWHSFGAPLQGH